MEQLIPILIAAVVFGFQAYANYQKEQEKARQRQQSKHRPPAETDSGEAMEMDHPFPDPATVPIPAEYIPAKPIQTEKSEPAPNPYGKYEGMIDVDKVKRLSERRHTRSNRKGQQTDTILDKKMEITDLESESDGTGSLAGATAGSSIQEPEKALDLRQAVIHSIILERPYRY